jgi:hypothetical protein
MDYHWRSLRFTVPVGFDDDTVVTFLRRRGDVVEVNITMTREALDEPIESYLKTAVSQLGKQLSGYRLAERKDTTVDGAPAVVLEHRATAPDGQGLVMLQAYLPRSGEVHIVTATGRDAVSAQVHTAMSELLASLRHGDGPARAPASPPSTKPATKPSSPRR